MTNINQTLAERGSRYGVFFEHARITQDLKEVMQDAPKWDALEPDQREALEMVAHKIGRILNGDPDYDDSWVDIAGYVTLVANRLQGKSDSGVIPAHGIPPKGAKRPPANSLP
jgi:hypothetical protein